MRISRILALALLSALTIASRAADPLEPLGQSSRLTSLVFSEVMYHPAERADGRQLEFIELFNSLSTPEDISGYRIDGDVTFTFPAGTTIPARSFLVVARNPADVVAVYGLNSVTGPFTGSLPNDRGHLLLRHRTGAIFLDANYDTREPWPVSPDGAGHSLVLARPSYGEGEAQAWGASALIGGSPGALEPVASDPAENVVINEFLAHTDEPEQDFIELYNHGNAPVDLSGCVLTDNAATNKFVFPQGSMLSARGFVSVDQSALGFSLAADGERIYLKNAAGTRVLDAVRFGGQENGVSTGRVPDGGERFYRLEAKSGGTGNGAIRVSEVVINEVMYHPISGDDDEQYVELFNRGAAAVNLSGWRLEDGVTFTIPTNTVVSAGGYLVIARDAANLKAGHTNLTSANTLGNFTGRLSGSGERIALSKPDSSVSTNSNGTLATNTFYITVDEVTYRDGGRWGQWSDGGGSSLERIDVRADGRRPDNWAESDESRKAGWTVVSRTGRLDNGNVGADQLQVLLQGAGECLIDDVEVVSSSGVNLIANSSFESGAGGWTAEGTEDRSSWESSEGYNSNASYHVRAVDRGDNQLNRIRTPLTQSIANGSIVTIRAKVRWLKGHPEVLFRLRGNWLEAVGIMDVPPNLGTPGTPNSRFAGNKGPAIFDVAHAPVLPAANQAVTVIASASDPDGVSSLSLKYRIDPSTGYTTAPMTDDGAGGDAIAGDGIFSARIPGQSTGTLVAYAVTAVDRSGSGSTYPAGAPAHESLVRFGETTPSGTFPVYRVWMTAATYATWSNRPKLNNTPLEVTFVLGGHRVIQNATAVFAGSPYISPGYNTPTGNRCGYSVSFPSDDPFLGDTSLVLDWPGGHGNENTAMQEQMGYWIADRMNLPYSHRYWIRLHVNGVTDMQRGTVFEAVNQPAGDFLDAWLPGAEEDDFYKIDRAFEFADNGSRTADPQPRLDNYTTLGGAKKTERYRWTFLKRSYDSANDYSNIFSLVDALNAPSPEPYTSQTEALVDLEEWIGILAVEHIIGNFDAYGHEIGKNMYAAKPENGKWQLYMFDLDWLMLAGVNYNASYAPSSAPLFVADDPTMRTMYNHPPFRRAYFRALKNALENAFRPELYNAVMDAKYAALVANGITMCDGQTLAAPTAVKNWFNQRRTFLQNQLNSVASPFEIASNSGADFSTVSEVVTLAGKAPIEAKWIRVNGVLYPVTWTGITDWSMRLALHPGVNAFALEAVDAGGNAIATLNDSISITSSAPAQTAIGSIVINEIMANPAESRGEFLELLNTSSNRVFDLAGWRINGLDYVFPNGSLIDPGGYLVVARDAGAFTRAYGNSVRLAGTFAGDLDRGGETLSLIAPDGTVADLVTFDDDPPWPSADPGVSLQLIDSTQDNSRVGAWGVAATSSGGGSIPPQWQYVTSTGTASSSRLYIYLNSPGEVYLDDLKLVAGSTPETGANMIANGDFESTFPGPWNVSANLTGSAPNTAASHSGARGLHVVSTAGGTTQSSSIWQDLTPLTSGATYTLSYWYLPSTNADSLTIRLSGNGINSTRSVLPVETAAKFSTPGAPNSIRRTLSPLPAIWINEIQPVNVSGTIDNAGDREPWLELYNSGNATVSLDGWRLSASATNLNGWAFPAGSALGPKQFLVIWLDGEPAESATGALHTSFRAPAANGTIVLAAPQNGGLTAIDYATYGTIAADRSVGLFPDGQAGPRATFFFATPGAANNNAAQPLRIWINEWMAANTSALADPADGNFDDWFELYNPNDLAVDLTGYFLSDTTNNPAARWRVPFGTIPANGFLLVWADNDTGQNQAGSGQLHAGFRLSQDGEAIAVFAPNGTLIDAVTFGPQTNNVSQGRFPDGSPTIQFLPRPSPAGLNSPAVGREIEVTARLQGAGIVLSWNAEPNRNYRVNYKDDLAGPWMTGAEITATSSSGSVVLPIENGNRFFRIERE